ncbi:short chain dehydrogenase family protein [Asticcacaulis biprosthecium C19]|uniref:Short chain dehydrogenase family protein n=2 Tax=Asticcacaulis biprosthecium TaxID=76891 RepID=F4QGH2_9CAUL|nr:short chain dehydrogenase family protein [Asticcacaulis biprosthecium C19]
MVLAAHGAQVTLACRDVAKGNAAADAIRRNCANAAVAVARLDLASLASVRSFADTVLSQGQPLHCLINNAGVMAPPKRLETEDGFELQFGTNVLGHFALTALLMPALERPARETSGHVTAPQPSNRARVVIVASIAHKRGRIDFDDLQSEKAYSAMGSYAQSKLADLMFAFELDRRLRAAGSKVLSVAVHPGVASTNLFRTGDYSGMEKVVRDALGPVIGAVLNTDAAGALPTLYASIADTVVGADIMGRKACLKRAASG